MQAIYWLILLAILLVVEITTLGLTAVWFAGGALITFFASLYGLQANFQIILFFVVSLSLLYFTRPWAMRFVNKNRTKTNVEDLVGKTATIIETVDNKNSMGQAVVNGQEWTARALSDDNIIEKGTIVTIAHISGVKLIVENKKEEINL